MELIPILSTMILVGTIATFILAVAAYILYKIRERSGEVGSPLPSFEEPETPHVMIAPAAQPAVTPPPAVQPPAQAATYVPPVAPPPPPITPPPSPQPQPQAAPTPPPAAAPTPQPSAEEEVTPEQRRSSLLWEFTEEGYVPVQPARRPRPKKKPAAPENPPEEEGGLEWL